MISHSWRRLCGSSPVVGSSRNRIFGLHTSAVATARRWRCPPESLPTHASAFSVEPTHWFHFAVVGLAQVAALDSDGHRLILTDVASSSFLANQLWTAFSRVADGNESSSTLVRCCRATCPRRENPVKIPHRL